jgi:hypothetical protein
MSQRKVANIIKAIEVTEGAGVTVHRTIGTPALRNLDPFLMLDHFSSDNPDDYIAGFPDHPHRGFITFTYMLDGHLEHQDSMGNKGDLRAGAAQWMKAASGVIHSEMPQQVAGLMRGFQLWINLPASEKMSEPEYQEYPPEAIPVHAADGVTVKVLIGQYGDALGPIKDPVTAVEYFDVTLDAGASFAHTLDSSKRAFLYLFEGDVETAGTRVSVHSLSVLGDGKEVLITAENQRARFILVAGQPIGEPIAQYGPFVMNTEQEIHQAMADYRDGTLVQKKAALISG